mmetsp:Transcript_16097/g.33036  ORF Transcript_16097/g.33036 Transcript_16097/m.33036 type:complete len:104 (+) Transcript_16097:407-718(+)
MPWKFQGFAIFSRKAIGYKETRPRKTPIATIFATSPSSLFEGSNIDSRLSDSNEYIHIYIYIYICMYSLLSESRESIFEPSNNEDGLVAKIVAIGVFLGRVSL